MDNQNRKLELLGNAPIPKALLAMGIPTMIGMLINALYNLVDAYFVGGLGESQMAAISVVYPLGQVVVGLGLLFGNGAASYISRLLGQRNKDQANKVASTALYSSLVVGAIMIVLSIIFLKPILRLLGATESVLPYATTYAGIYIISCIFNVFNVTMNNIVTSEGAAKTTMCALLLGAVLNIGLDPLFIYTFNFGVAGAAIATAISQVVSTLVYLFYIFRQKSAFQFRIKDCTFSKEILSEIFKIGVPTLIFQLLTSISISLINNAAGNYGDSAIAGMGVVDYGRCCGKERKDNTGKHNDRSLKANRRIALDKTLVWLKQNKSGKGWFFGLGFWTRGNAEICLLAIKGKPHRNSNRVHQFLISPIRGHSQKPEEAREKIVELMGDLPRVELFAREKTEGYPTCQGK